MPAAQILLQPIEGQLDPLKGELIFLLVKFWKICTPIIIYNMESADWEQMLQISAWEIAM